MWWLLFAVVIVLLWAGWFVFAFTQDRRRSRDTALDRERLDVDPSGPTSIPRKMQDDLPADPEDGTGPDTGRRPLE
jgi:hypothetical protein